MAPEYDVAGSWENSPQAKNRYPRRTRRKELFESTKDTKRHEGSTAGLQTGLSAAEKGYEDAELKVGATVGGCLDWKIAYD
jgi:hypothetical protein